MILFGSSTGAAAAIYSAYFKRDSVVGVISRGGRPDLVPSFILDNFPCYDGNNINNNDGNNSNDKTENKSNR